VIEPRTSCTDFVPDRISGFAKTFPNSIALSDGERTLNYQELDSNADRFAGYLIEHGVKNGGSVALCMDRSFEWITAALGILKAGAAYVPLDPAWPDARIRFAIGDSGAGASVGSRERLDRLAIDVPGIDPVRDAALINASSPSISAPVSGDHLAYIVYTSGSTGSPKGVEITHANLSHLARWHREAFGITRADRTSHLAGLGFDASVWEIWPNLCAGATLCLAGGSVRLSAETIQCWLIQERITVGFVPTVYAGPMMAKNWPAHTALRFLLTGGDALQHNPPASLPFKVVNNYGPAECTVVAASQVLKPDAEGLPPIGGAIAGARVYLLDEDRNPVAGGAIGEIYIGGGGVGRGYRNLPQATAQAFLPDPFADTPEARMYRSGDLAVRRPDGAFEFRGRVDRQIKIRGQRVELDEIGTTLSRHPGIGFGVVVPDSSPDGAGHLIGYFLPKQNSRVPSEKELKAYLRQSLPEYMVPLLFIQLESLPLSANGKIDLALLPQPACEGGTAGAETRAAGGSTETKLLSIVRDLLAGKSIALRDNLFLSGGHSLFGMQLLTRVRSTFGVELSLQQLFESPTVESLAVLINGQPQGGRDSAPVGSCGDSRPFAITGRHSENGHMTAGAQTGAAGCANGSYRPQPVPIEVNELGPLEPSEERLKGTLAQSSGVLALHSSGTQPRIFWVHNLVISLAKELGDDQPFVIVTLTSGDLVSLGERPSLEEIAARLLKKIVAVQSRGPFILGGVCIGSVLVYEIARQMRAAGFEVKLVILLDAPTQPYLRSCTTLAAKLRHPAYTIQRAMRIGLWKTAANAGMHLLRYVPFSIRLKFPDQNWNTAHGLIELAAFAHDPQPYSGDVLLLLSSHRVAHLDFLPGWQKVVRGALHIAYVDGYHRKFVTPQNAAHVAEIIAKHLPSSAEEMHTLAAQASSA
jgi:amino acid adenylation domain-containing protein